MLLLKSPCISHLFRSGCPSNVARFVIAVIIDAIYGVFWGWWISNVFVKSRKVSAPFFANGNASPSIIFETFVLWIVASALHSTPCSKNWGACFPMDQMSLTKNGIGVIQKLSAIFFSKTSAGNGVSCFEISNVNPSAIPAFTYAKPIALFRMVGSFPALKLIGDGQATESSTS